MLYKKLNEMLSDKQKSFCNWSSDNTKAIVDYIESTIIGGSLDISLPHLAEKYLKETYQLSFVLSKLNLIESRVFNNYAVWHLNEQTLNSTIPDYEEWLFEERVNRYMPRRTAKPCAVNLTKNHNGIQALGIVRRGFAYASQCTYSYDTLMLKNNLKLITSITVKGIRIQHEKGRLTSRFWSNEHNYANIVKAVLANIAMFGDITEYNMEEAYSDSRGRVIYKGLKRLFNPVSSKFARALLIVEPKTITLQNTTALNDIYYFIAELCGVENVKSEAHKRLKGIGCYNQRIFPKVEPEDYFEVIWLQRIYSLLDELYANGSVQWNVPLEVDMTASMLQIDAIFLNDIRLMEATNLVVSKEGFKDAWYIEGVRRKAVKATMTPSLYGSNESFKNLLSHKDIEIPEKELDTLKKASTKGMFALAILFKNAIIKSSNVTTPSFNVDFGDEAFAVEVNRFKEIGKIPMTTTAYDSKRNTVRVAITHKPLSLPDYGRFKTYMKTLFTHNRDSVISDYVALKFKEEDRWLITIHDAVLALPGDCKLAREYTVEKMEEFRANRHNILNTFRKSIGAIGHKADVAMLKVHKAVVEPNSEVTLNIACMK